MKARVYITLVLSRAQLGRGHHTHTRGSCVSLLISTWRADCQLSCTCSRRLPVQPHGCHSWNGCFMRTAMQRGSMEHSCRSSTLWCCHQKRFAGEKTRVGITKWPQHSAKNTKQDVLYLWSYMLLTRTPKSSPISWSVHLTFFCYVSGHFSHKWSMGTDLFLLCQEHRGSKLKGVILMENRSAVARIRERGRK